MISKGGSFSGQVLIKINITKSDIVRKFSPKMEFTSSLRHLACTKKHFGKIRPCMVFTLFLTYSLK